MDILKMLLAYIASWICYWIGDFVCELMLFTYQWWMFPTYIKLMRLSCNIQSKYNEKYFPWNYTKN